MKNTYLGIIFLLRGTTRPRKTTVMSTGGISGNNRLTVNITVSEEAPAGSVHKKVDPMSCRHVVYWVQQLDGFPGLKSRNKSQITR